MSQPQERKYSKTHEWVIEDGGLATVGITPHAADELGDIALVSLPDVGRVLCAGEQFGEIESLKAVSDLYAPISGTVTEVNTDLTDAPERVNDDAFGAGWLIRLQMSDAAELRALLDATAYDAVIKED